MSITAKPRSSTGFRTIVVDIALGAAVSSGGMLLSLVVSAAAGRAADWPSWGGQPSRNMASATEKGLPDGYSLGKKNDHGELDPSTPRNVKWVAKLGDKTFGSPVVSQGRVFIGTAGASSSDAALLCLDEQTGRQLGKFVCGSSHTRNFGVCSTPTVEGDRLYFVTPYPEVVCLDLGAWLKPPAAAGGTNPPGALCGGTTWQKHCTSCRIMSPVARCWCMATLYMSAPAMDVSNTRTSRFIR